MGRNRFVQPDSMTLPISDGDFLEVRRRLSAGDKWRQMAGMIKEARAGESPTLDPETVEKSDVMAYLIDWSLRDAQGKKVEIDKPAKLSAALDRLDPEDFREINEAIKQHVAAMEAEREAAKKTTDGGPGLAATSPSLVSATGGTNGSSN